MNLWKRWIGRPAADRLSHATGATCAFCDGKAVARSPFVSAYPVWDSACGAIGSGSPMVPDLDEVADALLAILGIDGSVSEPCTPTGDSGMMAMQHYDIPKSLDQLQAILGRHDFEMRTNTWLESGYPTHCIWVRARVA